MDWRFTFHYVLDKAVKFVLVILAAIAYLFLYFFVVAMTFSSVMFSKGGRAWHLAVAEDQLFNASLGGNEDETFSSRCYRDRHKKRYEILMNVLDWFFYHIAGEQNHCENAFLHEQAKRDKEFN